MGKKHNISGGGSNTNVNGLSFEGRTSLIEAFKNNKKIEINEKNEVIKKGQVIGYYVDKHKFYEKFLVPMGVDHKKIISSKILPDSAFINLANKTVYIGEKKYQQTHGSVDEKLQTGLFKKNQYIKLCKDTGFKVEYYYLLNEWFLKDKYRDVKEHIVSMVKV